MTLPKRFQNKIKEMNSKDSTFLDDVMTLLKADSPADRTLLTRISKTKNFVREAFPTFSESKLKGFKAPEEMIAKVIQSNDQKRQSKKQFEFSQKDVDELLSFGESSVMIRRLFRLLFVSGRRINEILGDAKFTRLPNKPNMIKASKLSKKREDKPARFKLLIPASEFIKDLKRVRQFYADNTLSDINSRGNKAIKKLFNKDYRVHSLRGMYAIYRYHTDNPESLNINGFISEALNHDSSDTSLSYSNYVFSEGKQPKNPKPSEEKKQ